MKGIARVDIPGSGRIPVQAGGNTQSGGINKYQSRVPSIQMINAWFFAALCLIFLAFCAIVRVIPGPTREDQLIAVTAAITIAAAAAIALSVFWQDLFLLDILIAIVTLCYAGTIVYAHYGMGEEA
jgi:multisubunit Na+/H+ antiporter MnhF subunit